MKDCSLLVIALASIISITSCDELSATNGAAQADSLSGAVYKSVQAIPQAPGCFVTDRINSNEVRGRMCNVRWETADIPILLEPASDGLRSDVKWAAERINSYIGAEVFTLDTTKGGYRLEIVEEDLQGGSFLGATAWSWTGFRLSFGRIAIWNGFGTEPSRNRALVVVHELLHALGVAHDETGCSIMKPTFDSTCSGIRRDDVRALRLLYGSTAEWHPTFHDGVDETGVEHLGLAPENIFDGRRICQESP